jgi:structural maintenance of chromosome 2
MEKDIAAGGVELAEARTHVAKTRAALDDLEASVKKQQKELRSIEAKIAEETKLLTAFKDELDALDQAIKAKRQEIADGDLTISEVKLEIERAKKDQKAAADAVAKLGNQFEWISDECQCVVVSFSSRCSFAHFLSSRAFSEPLARRVRRTTSRASTWAT